jgi:thiaminase
MQCHVEMTLPVMRSWMEEWRERLTTESPSVQSYRQIMQHLEDNVAALNIVAEKLYRRWVSTLQL